MYIQIDGAWRRSPMSPRELLEQLERNLTTAKTYSCQQVGHESVGGASATVFTAHTENEGVVGDTRTWIANATGLPVRQDEDLDTGMGDKRHMSLRFDYAERPRAGRSEVSHLHLEHIVNPRTQTIVLLALLLRHASAVRTGNFRGRPPS